MGRFSISLKNGIRHTGMPAWTLPDRKLWQVTGFICAIFLKSRRCHRNSLPEDPHHPAGGGTLRRLGRVRRLSHRDLRPLENDPHGQRGRDPREHPDAIVPDLFKPDPLLTFVKDEIAFVYGSKWKQRYFKRIGDDYFPLPAQWDVTQRSGDPTSSRTGRLVVAFYPPDNFQRPTGPRAMAAIPSTTTSTPKRLRNGTSAAKNATAQAASMSSIRTAPTSSTRPSSITCRPTTPAFNAIPRAGRSANPIEGQYYDWPVGFQMGKNSAIFGSWKITLGNVVHPFRRWHCSQESHAGERFREEPDVHPRCHVLHVPRFAWADKTTHYWEAGKHVVLGLPRPEFAERTSCRDDRSSTRTKRAARATNASPATCRKSLRRSVT